MLVKVRDNNINAALRILKKKLFNEGIIREMGERRFYEKPSDKRRRKTKESIRRNRREQEKHHAILFG